MKLNETKKIIVWNLKGGVAKTTTTMTMAFEIGKKGYKTLLVDMDPQSNLSMAFLKNERKDKEYVCMTNLFADASKNIIDKAVYKITENVSMIGANLGLANAELAVRNNMMADQLNILKHILETVNGSYDYVLVDCPPTINLLTINAMNIAQNDNDLVIIPVEPDEWAEEGFCYTLESIQDMNSNFGRQINYKVLFTRVNRNKEDRQVMDNIRKAIPGKYFETEIVYQAKPIKESKREKKSVCETKSNVGNCYIKFIDEFLGKECA